MKTTAITPTRVRGNYGNFGFCCHQVRPDLGLTNCAGDFDSIFCGFYGFTSLIKSRLNEDHTNSRYGDPSNDLNYHDESQKSHVTLSFQVLLGAVSIACGLFYCMTAFRDCESVSAATLVLYACCSTFLIFAGPISIGYVCHMLIF